MKLTWYGHACFQMETGEGTVVFDPYAPGKVPGVELPKGLSADLVVCSHQHADHNYTGGVALSGKQPGFAVRSYATWHDDRQGALRGANTITVIEAEGLRFAHLGDLGHMPDEDTLAALQGLDLVMIPVGGHYTIHAQEAQAVLEKLQPKVVVPMHYRGRGFGYEVIAPVEEFLRLRGDVQHYAGQEFTLTADTPAQTVVLECPVLN